jgi:hypothetical protein
MFKLRPIQDATPESQGDGGDGKTDPEGDGEKKKKETP